MPESTANGKTAFVFAGGGSLGAVEVGMLKALVDSGVRADRVIGASVGAINAAFFAGEPSQAGVQRLEAIWRDLQRADVFPFSLLGGLKGLLSRRDYLVEPDALARLLERHLPYRRLEDARIPCQVVATDLLKGTEVRLSSGAIVEALLASAAIPAVFPPVRRDDRYLVDGGVLNNTPLAAAIDLPVSRIIVLPTGYSCALPAAPKGAVATALLSLNLRVVRQLVTEVEQFSNSVAIRVVPPLCPVDVSPFDFSASGELIDRAAQSTEAWLTAGGLGDPGIPHQLPPHSHRD